MKDLPNNQESQKTPAEEIAKCISKELGIDIDQNSYRELIALIEKTFKLYLSLRMGRGVWFPLAKDIETLDNAISSLEEVRELYIVLPDYDQAGLVELHENSFYGEEDIYLIPRESGGQKTRRRKIKSVTKELGNIKKNLLGVVEVEYPLAIILRKDPKGWLAMRLFQFIRPALPGHVRNYQIDGAIYRLLKLYGVEEEESRNPGTLIRERRRRYSKKIHPHL